MSPPCRSALATHCAQAPTPPYALASLTHMPDPRSGEQMEVSGLRVSMPSLWQEEGMV